MSEFDVTVTIKLSDLVNLQNRVNDLDRSNHDLVHDLMYERDRSTELRDQNDGLLSEISHLNVYNAELRDNMERMHNRLDYANVKISDLESQLAQLNHGEGNWSVKLLSFGDNKINMIKKVRLITNLGLKETKDLVESAGAYYPATIIRGISEDGARMLADTLNACSVNASAIIEEEN